MSLHNDESGVSVIIGTLMLILITITAASGLALMVSGMQKEAMERESHIAAVESENLRIIAIEPVENSTDPTQWDSVNVTIMNLNTADSRITAISLNGVHARNYMAKDASGDLDYYKRYPSYPVIYNFKKRVAIPAAGSKEICLNFSGIVVNTSEVIDVSGWTNNSTNYNFSLSNHPRVAYPYALYPDMNCSENVFNATTSFKNGSDYRINHKTGDIKLLVSGGMIPYFTEIIDVSNWINNSANYIFPLTYAPIKDDSENVSNSSTAFIQTNNYTMDYPAGNITLIGAAFGGNMSNTSNYTITYNTSYSINYTTRFNTFPSPPHVYCDEPLTIEVITSLINIFKRTFMPPVPLAEVQVKSECVNASSHESRDVLILDASESFDPDGSIVWYGWSIYYDCDSWWWEYVNNETFNCADCNTPRNLSCRNDSNFDRIVNSNLNVSNETMVFGTNLSNANYTIDAPNGTITCNCSGNMSNHTDYNITYCYNCNGAEGRVHYLTGMKVRVNIANLHHEHCDECGPFDIDLDVIDDTWMIANLAQQSGKIYIPENQNFNNS